MSIPTIKTDIIIDGGNVVKSENLVILTDKVFEENRMTYDRNELLDKLADTFETDRIVFIPWDREEVYGHADGMVRFIDNDTVLINWMYRLDKNFRSRLLKPLRDKGFKIEWLDINAKRINKYNWGYVNFLQTKDLIIVPKFDIYEDDGAYKSIKVFYNSYDQMNRIFQVNSKEIALIMEH